MTSDFMACALIGSQPGPQHLTIRPDPFGAKGALVPHSPFQRFHDELVQIIQQQKRADEGSCHCSPVFAEETYLAPLEVDVLSGDHLLAALPAVVNHLRRWQVHLSLIHI